MTCTPTRLELSNTDATTVQVTVTPTPTDGTDVVLEVPGLSIDSTQTTTSGVASFAIPTRTEATNGLYDATIQVGTNNPAEAVVQIVATSAAQTVGVTVSGADVSYCAPVTSTVTDSYTLLIDTPAVRTYTIDARAATARTITGFYAKTDTNSCTAVLRNLTQTEAVGTISVTTSGGSAPSISNAAIAENDRLGIEITVNASATRLEMVVEYTT